MPDSQSPEAKPAADSASPIWQVGIIHLFYLTAVAAAAIELFGVGGIAWAMFVASIWTGLFGRFLKWLSAVYMKPRLVTDTSCFESGVVLLVGFVFYFSLMPAEPRDLLHRGYLLVLANVVLFLLPHYWSALRAN